jgi:hypothetical protein
MLMIIVAAALTAQPVRHHVFTLDGHVTSRRRTSVDAVPCEPSIDIPALGIEVAVIGLHREGLAVPVAPLLRRYGYTSGFP